MEYIAESIALGIDSIILAVCIKKYYKNKNAMALIQVSVIRWLVVVNKIVKFQGAPYLEINKQLKEIVETHPEGKLSYVSIRGTIRPLGNPIISINNPNVEGVVQLLRIKEHVIQRNSTGFWADSERIIQEVHNVSPFVLETKGVQIEVCDPLAAEVLGNNLLQPSLNYLFIYISGLQNRLKSIFL